MVVGIQGFRKNAVLDCYINGRQLLFLIISPGQIIMPIHRHVFIQAPAGRYMIDHDISYGVSTDRIIPPSYIGFAPAKAHMPYYNVVGVDPDGLTSNGNAVSGGRLAGNRNIGSLHNQGFIKLNNTRNIKYHNARANRLKCLPKRTGTAIFEACYRKNFASPSSKRIGSPALGSGKSGYLSLR